MATNLPAPPNTSTAPPPLPLSPRELLVAKLFADDHPAGDIGLALGLTLETVRSYLRVTYPQMVTEVPTVVAGHVLAPTGIGLGTTLLPEVRTRPDVTIRETTA